MYESLYNVLVLRLLRYLREITQIGNNEMVRLYIRALIMCSNNNKIFSILCTCHET